MGVYALFAPSPSHLKPCCKDWRCVGLPRSIFVGNIFPCSLPVLILCLLWPRLLPFFGVALVLVFKFTLFRIFCFFALFLFSSERSLFVQFGYVYLVTTASIHQYITTSMHEKLPQWLARGSVNVRQSVNQNYQIKSLGVCDIGPRCGRCSMFIPLQVVRNTVQHYHK